MRRPGSTTLTILSTVVAGFLTFLVFYNQYDKESRLIAQQHEMMLDVAYRSTIDMYRLDIETHLAAQVLEPRVVALLHDLAVTTDPARLAELRGTLYLLLAPAYRQMSAQGLTQLHFHHPDGRSFLRFADPSRSGDDITGFRASVRIANADLRPVFGFEGGRMGPAFRNVFPIVADGRHLGSVEISLGFDKIHENLVRLLPIDACALIVHRREAIDVAFPERHGTFTTSALHPDYVAETRMAAVHAPAERTPNRPRLDELLRDMPQVRAAIDRGESFAVPLVDDGRGWVVAFHAVRDATGEQAAYVVGYSETPVLGVVRRTAMLEAGGILTLLVVAGAAVVTLQRNRRRLAHERQQLDHITRAMADGLYVMDADGVALFVNSAAERLLRRPAAEIVGHRVHDLIHSHARNGHMPLAECPIFRATRAGTAFDGEEIFLDRDGRPFPVELSARPMLRDGVVTGSVTVFRDIGDRLRGEERTRLAASVFEHAHEGIVITDCDRRIVEVNGAFCRITGWSRDEIVGQTPRILNSGLQSASFFTDMWRTIAETGFWRGEIWNRRKNGSVYAELLTVTTVTDETGEVRNYVGVFSDITAIKQHERELERIAHFDPLTGVPNRVLLADRMRAALGRIVDAGGMVAICYLDIDGFKEVNDGHGHEVGDALLVEIVGRLADGVRADDTLARLGGDEFILVLQDIHRDADWQAALGRILDQLSRPFFVGDRSLKVSASIGVTLYPHDDSDPDTLLRHADQAMYQAKQAGRNRWQLFDPDHEKRERSQMQNAARIAEALDHREFVLYYQPKVDMRRGLVVGAEALIRWQHPQRGLLSPGEFLPEIENSPLIVRLGEWVIAAALERLAVWRAEGLDLHVGVNVAARQLQEPDFADRLRALLAAHPEVPPSSLELEVLETAALEDLAQVSEVIETCQALGVRFALDDFGTGYSTLTYIKRLPANTLKIDQSFVRDMLADAEDLSIVEGVIGMAKSFRREVVAEGVESVAHGTLLLKLDCELAQGFGIARPMPADRFADWVRDWVAPSEWRAVAGRAWDRADMPLVAAEVEIRHWIRALEQYVSGFQAAAPIAEVHLPRFMTWLRDGGGERYTHLGAWRRIETVRGRFETLVERVARLKDDGDVDAALAEFPEIYELQNEMIACLQALFTQSDRAA